ncbi:DNA excision repair protein ERCC-1 [Ornithorhynchus anatinus]|uniref:DNA excision repair protein ERCC-1 n=1 Tax=Ornithorhynchus anatinus TaxID=9258 RepID=UPI0010A770C2|nr:DNA excision repair protein ERCC-1 [Ornithorhynchus anatinus]
MRSPGGRERPAVDGHTGPEVPPPVPPVMEPERAAAPPPGRKRFTVPLEAEPPGPVKPLFKAGAASNPAGSRETTPPPPANDPVPPVPDPSAGSTDGTPDGAPTVKPGTRSSSIIVSPRQRGNPVLKYVRNVPWQFGDILPDYVLGQSTCALFLSLRYHNLHPNYIHERLQGLGKTYQLRVLLLQVDVKDPQHVLKELARMCLLAECTLILAWSPEEAGRYLETYKAYEQKPADLLKEKLEQDFLSRVTDCLTTVKSVNRTDSLTLLSTFGSLDQLVAASAEDLSLCPGFGPQKARRLFDTLHEPFLKGSR